MALFLAYLGWVTGAEHYSGLAREALVTLRAQLKQMKGRLPMIGGFCGWGGIIYALTHLGGLWQEPELTDEAERVVDLLPDLIGRDEELDVISGSAGCIVALLNLHRQRPSSKTMASAILCGERLCGRAEPMPDHAGRAVRTSGAKRPLAGFSHGAAGMAWSLLQLAGATHDARFREAALEMVRYERCLFRPEPRTGSTCATGSSRSADRAIPIPARPSGATARPASASHASMPSIRSTIPRSAAESPRPFAPR